MTESKSVEEVETGLFEGLLEALADKHSQLDINLQGVNIKLPSTRLGVELNGLVTLTAHVRDLTEEEKKTSSAKNIALMSQA